MFLKIYDEQLLVSFVYTFGRSKLKLKAEAKIERLREFIQFVSKSATRYHFSKKRIGEIEIATEEALVNIIENAYPDESGEVEIDCKLDSNRRFIIDIVDSGVPFDALSISDPKLNAEIPEREIGGLGMFLIKTLIDEVKYRRDGDKNILSFVVYENQQV